MRFRLSLAALLGAALLLGSAASAYAESVAFLGDGQRLAGTVPKGEVIRLTIPLPAGAEPRLNVVLKGSKLVPISFLRSDIYDPSGNLIPDTSRFYDYSLKAGKSTLKLREFIAPTSGEYQFVIETNSGRVPGIVELRVSGKLKVKRVTKVKERFTVAGASVAVGLQKRDRVRAKVTRVNGDLPKIAAWITPVSFARPPIQKDRW